MSDFGWVDDMGSVFEGGGGGYEVEPAPSDPGSDFGWVDDMGSVFDGGGGGYEVEPAPTSPGFELYDFPNNPGFGTEEVTGTPDDSWF